MKLKEAQEIRKNLETRREELRDTIRSLKSEADAVRSEVILLRSIADSNEAIPGSVSYLIENHTERFNLLVPVGELLQTSEEFVFALEAALGDAVNYMVTETWQEAILASQLLRENNKGRATFIPLNELKKGYDVANDSVLSHVSFEKEFKPLAELLLGQTILAGNPDEARERLKKTGSSAVTMDGEYITGQHLLKGGSKNRQAGVRLGLKDKLEKLAQKEIEITGRIAKQESELEAIVKQFNALNLDQIRQQISEKQKQLREFEQQMSRHQSEIQLYEKSIRDLKERQETLTGSRDQAVGELEELQPRQKEHQKKISDLSQKQEELKQQLQSLEEERSIAQNRYNDSRLKHQDVKNRAENLSRDIERAANGITGMQSRLESRSELLIQSNKKIGEFDQKITETKSRLEQLREQKEAADQKLQEAEKASGKQRGLIHEIEKELKELRRKKEVNLELVHHLSMAREKFEMQAQGLSDHIWETYGVLMDQLKGRTS
jgi:chromosome segregation protein